MPAQEDVYQRWVELLGCWGEGEPIDPASLPPIPADYPPDSLARFGDRCQEALRCRLRYWQQALVNGLKDGSDEFTVALALTDGRRGLAQIDALISHESITGKFDRALKETVEATVRAVQRMLLDQTEDLRREGGSWELADYRRWTIESGDLTRPLRRQLDPE